MTATVFYNDINEIATLTNTFKVAGVPTDPTVATVVVTDPTGVATTYTGGQLTHTPATGLYTVGVPCSATVDGVWTYKWTGTGAASDAAEGTWTVTRIDQTLYCTVEEMKSRLVIPDTADDFELTLAVQAACRSIDQMTGRYFWRGTDTRTYMPGAIYGQEFDDIVSVSSFKMDRDGDGVYEETWVQGTDYQLSVSPGRYNTGAKGEQWPYTGFNILGPKWVTVVWPWSHLDRIQITGVFGWPAVPAAVKQASLISAADLFRMKDAPFGVAGFGEFGAVKITANPKVMALLQRYISPKRVGV
jgi:hypothetical protein